MIHRFDPVIYPFKIWIAINPSFEEVSESFYGLNSEIERTDIDKSDCEHDCFTIARTCAVAEKNGGWIGPLVYIFKPKRFGVNNICHESAHCADFICEQLGITTGCFDDGEAHAYLVGWIAGCCDKVKKGKI